MDKYEYKVRADEIKDLIAQGEYVQAAEIADTIDWRRVKSVMMLCTISDLYKINRRYEDARNMLLLAYERRPGGRTICYSLCELSIKMEDYVPAVNYYKEFVQVAPKDPGRYILQYKLYEAQDVSLEERIGVLEELKKRDYREKWAYELAYLYHRVGLGTRCVEECDELILWFGEGKYVVKAMELKMLHQPLTPSQQEKYDHRFEVYGQTYYEPQREAASQGQSYYVSSQEASQTQYYEMQQDGISQDQIQYENQQGGSQEQLYYETEQQGEPQEQFYYETEQAGEHQDQFYYESRQEMMPQEQPYYESRQEAVPQEPPYYVSGQEMASGYEMGGKTRIYESPSREMPAGQEVPREQVPYTQQDFPAETAQLVTAQPEELDIQVKPMDMGQYNTINLQAEIAAGLKEVLEEDQKAAREDEITRAIVAPMLESETESLDLPEIDEVDAEDLEPEAEVMEGSEVFFGETGEIGDLQASGQMSSGKEAANEIVPEIGLGRKAVQEAVPFHQPVTEVTLGKETVEKSSEMDTAQEPQKADTTAEIVMAQLQRESRAEEQVLTAQPPKEIAGVLSQESDGQISFVMPENEQIEKQITGQMNLEDILKEWERMKQENAEKRKEEVRQHVLRHTGEMFTAFEAAVRDGLLEQLESDNAKAQDIPEEPFTEGEDTAGNVAAEETLYEESVEEDSGEELTDGYLEENEDWDSQPSEEPEEEELEEILKEAEQEVIFGDADGVEEIEEIEEAEESAPEEEESEEAASETEEPENPESEEEEFEEAASETKEPENPESEEEEFEEAVPETEEPEDLESEEEESEEDASETEEPGKAASESGESANPDTEEAAEPKKSEKEEAVKSASRKPQTNKTEEAESPSVEREKGKVRSLTKEEKELYGPYIQSRASREQLVQAIDNISMAAYTGNIIITGEEGMDTVSLAKDMIREVQMTDSNFAGKVAKISGQALNKKDVETTVNQLASGALIIQKASGMDADTVKRLHKALQQESFGIIIILEDVKKTMNKFLEKYPKLAACFTARMDVESLSNGTLVAFGRKYAREREYSIDDMGILALHTRIDEMQTSDHVVTVLEVKELVDSAIKHANKKTLKHFFDILLAKRYDEEDMIILTERDFV